MKTLRLSPATERAFAGKLPALPEVPSAEAPLPAGWGKWPECKRDPNFRSPDPSVTLPPLEEMVERLRSATPGRIPATKIMQPNPENTSCPSQAGEPPALDCGDLFGVLTRAGSLVVNEESDCGLVISMTQDELRAVKHLPMYRRVKIVTASEWNERLGERDHLLGALRAIQRIWQTQSEACADNSRAGELMAQEARNATAFLDSPNKTVSNAREEKGP